MKGKTVLVVLVLMLIILVLTDCSISFSDEMVGEDEMINLIYSYQRFSGEGGCKGLLRGIYRYEGSVKNLESISGEELLGLSEMLHEEEILFTDPKVLETIPEEKIFWEGTEFLFEARQETATCYVPQIGDVRLDVSVDCYGVEAQEKKLVWLDGPRGISGWKNTKSEEVFVWKEEGLERLVLSDGSAVEKPAYCVIKETRPVYVQARVRPVNEVPEGWITKPFGYPFCPVIVSEEIELTKDLIVFTCSILSNNEEGFFSFDFVFEPQELTEEDVAPVYRIEYMDGHVEYEWFGEDWTTWGRMIDRVLNEEDLKEEDENLPYDLLDSSENTYQPLVAFLF